MTKLLAILIKALIMVESSGNVNAIGDGGAAVGCLQIHKCVIDDVNRIYHEDFRYEDRLDRDKSIRICELYLSHWGTHYSKTTGKDVTLEVLARIWSGGPRGYEKNGTIGYWKKVQKAMEQ